MKIVDSHCHLNFPEFQEDFEAVLHRAAEAGVGLMQTICTEIGEFEELHRMTQKYEPIFCSVGVHPNDVYKSNIAEIEELCERAALPKVIGIGETGLDFHYQNTPREQQYQSFINHIEASRRTGLPVIIHSRDADNEMIEVLQDEMRKGKFTAVLHCFSSGRELAERAVELGIYISFSGILTFKNSHLLKDIAKDIPLDMILVETDAPFLAPVPNRGKRNEPAFTLDTAEYLGNLKGIPLAEIAEITTNNFYRLFDKSHLMI